MNRKKNLVRRLLSLILIITAACTMSGCGVLQASRLLCRKAADYKQQLQQMKNNMTSTQTGTPAETTSPGTVPGDTERGLEIPAEVWDYAEEAEMYAAETALIDPYMLYGSYAGNTAGYSQPEPFMPDWNTEEYNYLEENGWLSPLSSPFSTFAADVDTAFYSNVRRKLLSGQAVPKDAVRIEEMINYFDYSYPDAEGNAPFSVTTRIAPCPWNEDTQLMLVGLKARVIPQKERPASNLVFLIDVSGSMDDYDKLPLVQRAFRLLAGQLGEEDTVSLVTYAYEDTIVLDGVSGSEKAILCDAIEDLSPNGGTNGSAGLIRAYELAEKHFIPDANNRVILATDGDLNIGMTDEGSLVRLIREKAASGVFLSVLGFGTGNISDARMEAMADNGNGNYRYIDSIQEARKSLIDEAGGTLFTVAKDVKLQVEFNPAKVKGYRLIGYENRMMSAESFADDTKDGGEIGSGHCVTALYEIASTDSAFEINTVESRYAPAGSQTAGDLAGEWAAVHIRYKEPSEDTSLLLDTVVDDSSVSDVMDENLSWAAGVAQTGMILKDSPYAGTTDMKEVRERLKTLAGDDEIREEFLYLLTRINMD